MPFQYKKVLVIGATSGIGEALAEKLLQEGSQVIAVGRRKEKLEELVHRNGRDKVSAVPFDITNWDAIPNFVTNVTKTHSDLDCILLNSGIQRGFDFSKPETVDMDAIKQELDTNYLSYLALTKGFLPFLLAKESASSLIFTTSGLGIVPMTRAPNYCASKAAMHQFIMVLREQLGKTHVKVIEIFPPAVQTELHDEKHQPDIKNESHIGIPLKDFTEAAYSALSAGKEQIPVEAVEQWFDEVEIPRQAAFDKVKVGMAKMVETR